MISIMALTIRVTKFQKITASAITSSVIFSKFCHLNRRLWAIFENVISSESFVSKNYFFLFWLARLISFWSTLVWLGVRLLSSLQTNDFFLFQSHHPCKFNTQSAWSSFSFLEDEMQKKSLYSAPVINLAHVSYTFFHMWYEVVFVIWKFDGINPRQKFAYGEVV